MRLPLKIYYTVYGEVYAGYEAFEPQLSGHKVIIVGTRLNDYLKLSQNEKTKEKLREFGWVIRKDLIAKEYNNDELPERGPHENGSTTWYGNRDHKTMFIIGAGASANCVTLEEKNNFENDPLRPPLGNQLFDNRFKKYYASYPGVRESLYYLRSANADVEAMLENDWTDIFESGNAAVMRRHINIQFYLQHILSEVSKHVISNYDSFNLYNALCDKLKRIHARSINDKNRCFAFVSFNQDTILDTFLSRNLLRSLNSFDDYIRINENPYCLFKPHGSWNWAWKYNSTFSQSVSGNRAQWLYESNTSIYDLYFNRLGHDEDMIDWNSWGYESGLSKFNLGKYSTNKSKLSMLDNYDFNNSYPGILLPYRDKDEFVMPLQHFYTLEFYLNKIETIVTIGWKGNEASFNRLLNNHGHQLGKVIIVDPNPQVVEDNLKEILSKPNVQKVHYSDFESFVMTGVEKELNQPQLT